MSTSQAPPSTSEPAYDCQQCGACCADHGFRGGPGYVYLNRAESKRMKRIGLSVVQLEGDSFLGTRLASLGAALGSICVAFQGELGQECGCSIYQCRPTNCRTFEVGGVRCQAARKEVGLPV